MCLTVQPDAEIRDASVDVYPFQSHIACIVCRKKLLGMQGMMLGEPVRLSDVE